MVSVLFNPHHLFARPYTHLPTEGFLGWHAGWGTRSSGLPETEQLPGMWDSQQ